MNHRQKAEEVYASVRNLGEEGHPIGWGHNLCASENEGDICCIEKGKEVFVDSVTSALKETEKDTWARAEKAIQACDPMARGESLIFQTLLDALREEAGKEWVDTDCCGYKACCKKKV